MSGTKNEARVLWLFENHPIHMGYPVVGSAVKTCC